MAKKNNKMRQAYCQALADVIGIVLARGNKVCAGVTVSKSKSKSDKPAERKSKKLTLKKMSEAIVIPKRKGHVTCNGDRAKYCRETKRAAKFCVKKTYRTTALSGGRKAVTCESKKSGKRIVQAVLHPKNGKICKAHGC